MLNNEINYKMSQVGLQTNLEANFRLTYQLQPWLQSADEQTILPYNLSTLQSNYGTCLATRKVTSQKGDYQEYAEHQSE